MGLIKIYNLRKSFMEKIRPDYDNSSLTDLLRWFGKVDCFDADLIKKEWDSYIASRKSKRTLFNFYIHIPFCSQNVAIAPIIQKSLRE